MSQISSYKTKNKPIGSDVLIGTSSINGQTKNFSVDALSEAAIDVYLSSNSFVFVTQPGPGNSRPKASISFEEYSGNLTNFADINTLYINTAMLDGTESITYLNRLVGKGIVINDQKSLDRYGVYTLESLTLVQDSVYEMNLNFIEGSGTIAESDYYNISIDAKANDDTERNARIQADNNLQSQIDAISENDTLDTVTTRGNTTTNNISVGDTTATSFTKVGGVGNEFLKADGSVDSTDYATSLELSSEETARIAGDANLQSQISAVSTGYVPYTGATQDVDLGLNALRSQLVQITGGVGTQGTMTWNTDDETIDVILNGSVLQMGQEIYVQVRNNTATDIPNGTPVYVTGTLGASTRLTVAPMIADGSIAPKFFIGVTTELIEAGTDGKCTWFGKVRQFDTSIFPEGTTLYISESTAGGWQSTRPISPNPSIEVAFTVNSKSNGAIFVRGDIPLSINDLTDAYIDSVNNGDVLVFNSSTNRWENSNALTTETSDRQTADSNLQGNIDTLETYVDNNFELQANKNVANGYAPLDSSAKIPLANLPDSILGQVSYQGTWNASTNTPELLNPPAPETKGEYYIVDVSGTQFGISFAVGDWIISKGDSWQKVDNTDAVTTVFGRLGAIVANESDYSGFYPLISDLTTETNARILADTDLATDIATNTTNISTNTTNISTNTTNISTNASAIEAEIITRGNADTTLQNNIDTINNTAVFTDSNASLNHLGVNSISAFADGGNTGFSYGQMYISGGVKNGVVVDARLDFFGFYTTDIIRIGYDQSGSFSIHNPGGGFFEMEIDGDLLVKGLIRAEGDVVAFFSSDKRLKDNIEQIPNAIDKIQSIGGYSFNWNDKQDTYEVGSRDIGVVAQEIEEVLPELVTTRDDGYKAVKYEKIVALLIEGIKEQQEQINELKTKLDGITN